MSVLPDPKPLFRPAPQPAPETVESGSRGRAPRGGSLWGGSLWGGYGLIAALTVGTGAFFYTHNTTAPPSTSAATPAAGVSTADAPAANATTQDTPAVPDAQTAAVQLSMIAPSHAPRALEKSGFGPQDRARILAAVRDGKMRLVEMPVLDASGATGQAIDVTVSGMTQHVVLTGKFQHLIIPIAEAGQILIAPATAPHLPGLIIGALTALGPQALPALTTLDQRVLLNVIVQ